jgi:ornithine cyclodeaminase
VTALPYLDGDALAERLPWPVVVDELAAAAAAAFAADDFVDRTGVTTSSGQLLLMPAVSDRGVGVKLVGIGFDNATYGLPRISGLYVLYDSATLAPVALLDGTTLTTIRTAGQSAMAVARLAAPDARRLVVFGTGPQAHAHARAISSVRPIESLGVVGRRAAAVEAMCRDLRALGLPAVSATPDDVAEADLVVCATTSTTPVFDGRRLPSDVCIVAVGSHTAVARELDDATFSRARVVLVEHRATALREAGDVIQAIAAGVLAPERIRDFGRLDDPLVRPASGIAVYKSVGMAYQDLALAVAAVRREST